MYALIKCLTAGFHPLITVFMIYVVTADHLYGVAARELVRRTHEEVRNPDAKNTDAHDALFIAFVIAVDLYRYPLDYAEYRSPALRKAIDSFLLWTEPANNPAAQ